MIKSIKNIRNQVINKLFLILFPPIGEESISEIDIRLGLVLSGRPDILLVIGTDMNDIWTPLVTEESIPVFSYNELDFENRVVLWMKQELTDEISLEYYDFTKSDNFNEIVGKEIEEIEFLFLEGNPNPFGIKILLKNDFILSFPNSDGNTIETTYFNKNNNIKNFKYLGEVIFIKA
jgi:hypothetical protein